MKNLIVVLFVAFGFYSCTDSSDYESPNCGTVTNVAFESFDYCGTLKENPKQPVFVVLNSKEEFDKIFTTCETFAATDFPDFTQKRVLALFSGPKPTGGYDIQIQSVIQDDCQIVVEFFETEPKTNEGVSMAVTYPVDYVVLPKSNKPLLFSKVNRIADYAIVGTYVADPTVTQCAGDCNTFYKIDKTKVVKYLNANNFPVDFNGLKYKALGYIDDYTDFLLKVPTEIKNVKGQTKTYGTPGIDGHGGVYFEWKEGDVVTKIYLDNNNTTDQTPSILEFKKIIQDKITELKTKS